MKWCVPIILLLISFSHVWAEEIFFQDGKRMTAMVESVDSQGKVTLRRPDGTLDSTNLKQMIAIVFRGREPRALLAGTQEFHFVSGDRLKGQIVQMAQDALMLETFALGALPVPLASLRGFLTMPVEGKAGRRAIELLRGENDEPTGKMDQVVDRRASDYEGVLEDINAKELRLDHERLRQIVSLNILHLAGVRMARDTQNPSPSLPAQAFLKIHTRDQSSLEGILERVDLGKWMIRPRWQPGRLLAVGAEEITSIEILNGQTLYLSQLPPKAVLEKTILAPPQRYRFNQNAQGNPLRVGGQYFAWGIGVHAHCALTFDIGGRWARFESLAGIDDQMGKNGSVVFKVLGDGKELFRSPVMRGAMESPAAVTLAIKGVKELTLVVEPTEDLDLCDLANWAGARLLR